MVVEDEYLCKEKLVVYVEIQGTSKTLEPWKWLILGEIVSDLEETKEQREREGS